MAQKEACEVFIEQQIDDGLEAGETPYSIGQSLSKWIEKLFDTRIKPGTLKQRAARKKGAAMGTNVPKANPPKSHTTQDTKIQLESVAEEIKQGTVSDDDIKTVGDAISEAISSGKAAVRVGTKVKTAVKKKRRTEVKGGKKKDLKSNVERLSKHVLSAAEGLTFLADGEIEPEHEDDQTYFKIIRKAAPTIILQYARLGIDVVEAAEFAMIHCNEKGDTIDVKQLKSANGRGTA